VSEQEERGQQNYFLVGHEILDSMKITISHYFNLGRSFGLTGIDLAD